MEVLELDRPKETKPEIAPKIINFRLPQHEYLLEYFEDWDVGKCFDPAKLDYQRGDNWCGYQQRSWLLYQIRSEEHTSELQSHSFISYAVFCLKKKTKP